MEDREIITFGKSRQRALGSLMTKPYSPAGDHGPAPIPPGTLPIASLAAGGDVSAAVTEHGDLYVWGACNAQYMAPNSTAEPTSISTNEFSSAAGKIQWVVRGRRLSHRFPRKRQRATEDAQIQGSGLHLHTNEPYRGPNSPVSGYRLWLPGGGLVHVHAKVHQSVVVEAGAVVQETAEVSQDCHICSGSVVGPNTRIGESSIIGFQAALQHCTVGAHCHIHAGARLGGEGFVLHAQPDGSFRKRVQEQIFRVELREEVEIGANSVVDRGSWRNTCIDRGVLIDSLVHIGHDCTIGRSCIICAHASVGPSSSLGDDVIIGHRAAVKDHISIVAKTRIAAKSGVVRDISDPGDYAGHPAMPAEAFKQQVLSPHAGQEMH